MVTILKTSTIVPTEPTKRHLMYLSSLDLFFRDIHYNLRVLFYEQIGPAESSQFVATLKKSLGEALVHFYPLAGRLAAMDDDGRFAIDCNDEGVEFVEAQVSASFEDLKREHFDFKPYFAELAQLGHLTRADLPHLPLMSIQITEFLGGGIALAISHNHVVMDGPSLWHFWVSWSECARGLPISKPPIHTRTHFKPDKVSQEIANLMPFEMKPMQSMTTNGPLVDKVMHFSNEAMGKLKEMGVKARSKIEGPKRQVSSLEVLFAHCWRRVTYARKLEDDQELSFVVLADWRRPRATSKNPPPVPENYFGNAITWTCANATPHILDSESFAATLTRIANAVDECTHLDTLHGTIHWLELHDTHFQLESFWFPGITMNVASSPRFPTHLVDFGWGRPTSARPIRVGGNGGEICLFPSCHGGVDVCIKLDVASLQRLVDDPFFLCPSDGC